MQIFEKQDLRELSGLGTVVMIILLPYAGLKV